MITGVPISFLLGLIGLLFDKNKVPALVTLIVVTTVLAFMLLQ